MWVDLILDMDQGIINFGLLLEQFRFVDSCTCIILVSIVYYMSISKKICKFQKMKANGNFKLFSIV